MYWNTYRLSYSGHVIFKVAIKKDNEAYPHINGSMKKLATRAICAGHLASCSNFYVGQAAVNLLSQIQLKSVTLLFSLSLSPDGCMPTCLRLGCRAAALASSSLTASCCVRSEQRLQGCHELAFSCTQNDRLILVVCSIGLDTGTKFAVCVKAVRRLLACTSDGLSDPR